MHAPVACAQHIKAAEQSECTGTRRVAGGIQGAGAATFLHFDDSTERFLGEFIVFDSPSEELIIGAQSMQGWHVTLDFENESVSYPKIARRLRV